MDTLLYLKAYEQIKKSNNILIVTHGNPDGDAIASACTMAEILESLNQPYIIYCTSQIYHQYNFLPHTDKFKTQLASFDFDLIIAIDCGSLKRTNLVEQIKNRRANQFTIEFDHHPRVESYANIEIRNPEAASTTEVLYDFIKANKIKINKNIANCILTGILTDTANFLYPTTSSKTINIASEMLAKGAKLPQIIENTWRNKTMPSIKMWGKAMSNLFINDKYNFAITVLTSDDINNNINEEDLEGLAGFLSSLGNVKAILFLHEQKPNLIKGSLRTIHPQINISRLANILGGGGHAKASAFTMEGKIEKTEKGWKVV